SPSPGDSEAEEQDGVGEVDRNRLAHEAVLAEQRDRSRPQQVCAAPPRNRVDLRVLHPREQQQQPENGLDEDGDLEQGADVEIHRNTIRRAPPTFRASTLGACRKQSMKVPTGLPPKPDMVLALFSRRAEFDSIACGCVRFHAVAAGVAPSTIAYGAC